MGLLTASGMLLAKHGLSARAQTATTTSTSSGSPGSFNVCLPGNQAASPTTRSFVEPLPIMPLAQTVPVSSLSPAPTIAPNTAGGEVRAADHQGPELNPSMFPFPPPRVYQVRQHAIQAVQSPDLPTQTIWAFDDGFHATSPGPTYGADYGIAQLVRNINALPPVNQNGGFGMPSVTTHLHNGHTPSESDGNPCDFYPIGNFCDQYYPNVLAGFSFDHQPTGDINESLSTLWYHDHRVDFTAQNTYKGLLGFYCLFNQFDTGDETTGFHLPSFPQFDIPLAFADKVYDPTTGTLAFDLFHLDGILGDKFLVNGKIQPFLQVHPRRYRLRWTNAGPSRWQQFFLTDVNNLSANNRFWQIANDGNLLPAPVQVSSVELGVAERADVIIDFSQFKPGQSIYLENRLEQNDGRGPTGNTLAAGQGNLVLRFDVVLPAVADNSQDP